LGCLRHIRFAPESDRSTAPHKVTLRANSGLIRCSKYGTIRSPHRWLLALRPPYNETSNNPANKRGRPELDLPSRAFGTLRQPSGGIPMTRTTSVIAAGLALAATLSAAPANAQSIRTFVPTAGSDNWATRDVLPAG
jgi:hypothetical protein